MLFLTGRCRATCNSTVTGKVRGTVLSSFHIINMKCFWLRPFSFCFRYLCDQVVPGNRVTILGIYSIKKMAAVKAKGKDKGSGVGIRSSYLRVVGIQVDMEGAGKYKHLH